LKKRTNMKHKNKKVDIQQEGGNEPVDSDPGRDTGAGEQLRFCRVLYCPMYPIAPC
jgi:hypothetical protein